MEAPGSYIAAECAGVPVLVARGADGRLRAFYNVRAAPGSAHARPVV